MCVCICDLYTKQSAYVASRCAPSTDPVDAPRTKDDFLGSCFLRVKQKVRHIFASYNKLFIELDRSYISDISLETRNIIPNYL